ncbi:hypothetical protein I7V30_01715 [Lelliottia amnigena]|uniref:hypothetical protein n=1 Tax=Lelliottia amnigena TaxID=61646 RepID=UPI00192CCC82|nr:hypothetical protein [Lelliottia amnigena]MBL5963988.1 hypothetical protein [Lelliottia amnigena]
MHLIEMDGFLRGKCLPGDMKVNETNAEYLVRKFAALEQQLAESQSKLEKMAAENAVLKKYICDECYVENIKTGAAKCAGLGMPETPATDAFLAEVRAQGVEMAANMLNHNHPLMSEAADAILYHAAQLRQGAAK